ncbi:MAG: hypothetical protein QW299_08765, partial [Candidatus Caldarchaeum sp.]
NEESLHTYSVDGEEFYRVSRVSEIPAEAGDELYVDVIPVELTDEFIEVLRRGVRVFYLRRLMLMARKREELGLSKTSRNDVRTMMALETRWFREVTEDYLVMRRLTTAYRSLLRIHASILNRAKALQDVEKMILMESAKAAEGSMRELASLIVAEAARRYPLFNKVAEELGITGDNHLFAREALAEIISYVERSTSYRRLREFFGLFQGRKGVNKFYSKTARVALVRLTSATLHNTIHRAGDEEQLLRRIWKTVKETRERLEAPA